jgi:hypothetical protein
VESSRSQRAGNTHQCIQRERGSEREKLEREVLGTVGSQRPVNRGDGREVPVDEGGRYHASREERGGGDERPDVLAPQN